MDSSSPGAPQPLQPSVAPQTVAAPQAQSPSYDPAKVKRYVTELRDRQNLGLGLLGGVVGATIGAAAWAIITVLTNFQIGFMAIGVGLLTGFGVRRLGRGVDKIFGYAGAALALLGCAAGNILAVMIMVSTHEHIAMSDIALRMTPQLAFRMLSTGFGPIDVLFYGLGLYYGYRNSFHRITKEELATLS